MLIKALESQNPKLREETSAKEIQSMGRTPVKVVRRASPARIPEELVQQVRQVFILLVLIVRTRLSRYGANSRPPHTAVGAWEPLGWILPRSSRSTFALLLVTVGNRAAQALFRTLANHSHTLRPDEFCYCVRTQARLSKERLDDDQVKGRNGK